MLSRELGNLDDMSTVNFNSATKPWVISSESSDIKSLFPPNSCEDRKFDMIKEQHRRIAVALTFALGGTVMVAATTSAADAPGRTGKQVADSTCAVCHTSGAAGAPKIGDAVSWKPRIAQGADKMFEHVVKGYKAMPARGTCTKCTDAEIKAAIDYFVAKAQEKK